MEVIATIPYTPRRLLAPGYLLGPFSAHLIALHEKRVPLIAVNRLGSRGFSRTDGDRFVQVCERVFEGRPLIWRDDDQNWTRALSAWSTLGFQDGWLTIEPREVWRCSCGFVEFLPEPLNLVGHGFRRKAYSVEGQEARCDICRTFTRRYINNVLLMRLPSSQPMTAVYPAYASKEWQNLGKQLNGKQFLVSRARQTGLHIDVEKRVFHIDIDICSMLMPFLVHESGDHIKSLICGHKTLKQAFLATQVTRLMWKHPPDSVHAVPYLAIRGDPKDIPSLEILLDKHGAATLRVVYATAFGHRGKLITLDLDILDTIDHALGDLDAFEYMGPAMDDLSDLYRGAGLNTLQKSMSLLRRRRSHLLTNEMRYALALLLSRASDYRNR